MAGQLHGRDRAPGGRPEVRAVVRILHEALPRKTQSEKAQSQYPWPPQSPWTPAPTPEGCVSDPSFLFGTRWLTAMPRPQVCPCTSAARCTTPGAPFTVQFKSTLPWNRHRTRCKCSSKSAGPASRHRHHRGDLSHPCSWALANPGPLSVSSPPIGQGSAPWPLRGTRRTPTELFWSLQGRGGAEGQGHAREGHSYKHPAPQP